MLSFKKIFKKGGGKITDIRRFNEERDLERNWHLLLFLFAAFLIADIFFSVSFYNTFINKENRGTLYETGTIKTVNRELLEQTIVEYEKKKQILQNILLNEPGIVDPSL